MERPALADIVAEPRLDVDRGFYESAFNLTLTCATPDAFISYTTDGSEPTAKSPIYEGPIPATGKLIKAACFNSKGRAGFSTEGPVKN